MSFQLILPDIGEGVVEAEVQKWLVSPGDAVEEDQPLVEIMTDKATVTIPSPRRGRVTRLMWKEGDIARVHQPLLEMEVEGAAEPARISSVPTATSSSTPAVSSTPHAAPTPTAWSEELRRPIPAQPRPLGKVLATPVVRALARQMGIDIAGVTGTGPGGRVTKDDLGNRAATNGHSRPAAQAPRAPANGAERRIEVIPVHGLRRRIAEKMAQSKRSAAHFTFVEQVDVTELVKLKERMASAAAKEGVKLTFLPFFVKATVASLKRHPTLNASLDEEKGEIQVKRWYDIGIASATDQGLTVPVVRRAGERSLLELAQEIERLSAETKAGRGRPEDMGGSTFTITSLGALGGLFATPIINYPEVAILGIHRIRPTPIVKDGQIVARDVMHVSLSFDHRVIDGHIGAAFTYTLIGYLEDPSTLFLEMS